MLRSSKRVWGLAFSSDSEAAPVTAPLGRNDDAVLLDLCSAMTLLPIGNGTGPA